MPTINPAFLLFGVVLCFVLLLIRRPQALAIAPGFFGAMVFGAAIYAVTNWNQIATSGQQVIATYLH